jgi:hypothetical protein
MDDLQDLVEAHAAYNGPFGTLPHCRSCETIHPCSTFVLANAIMELRELVNGLDDHVYRNVGER